MDGVEEDVEEKMELLLDDDDIADDVVDTVELLSREVRLAYLCLDLKLPQPFLISLLRGDRANLPVDDESEMTRVEREGSLETLESGLLLLCPALCGDSLKWVLNLAMTICFCCLGRQLYCFFVEEY